MVAPTLDTTYIFALPDVQSGNADPAGIQVSDLIPDGAISDPDGVIEGIAITALDTSLGFSQYRLCGTTRPAVRLSELHRDAL